MGKSSILDVCNLLFSRIMQEAAQDEQITASLLGEKDVKVGEEEAKITLFLEDQGNNFHYYRKRIQGKNLHNSKELKRVSEYMRKQYLGDYLETEEEYEEAKEKWQNTSPISGIFKSFTDAPGGFKEELREINFSIGAEYSYNQQFFLRAGYFNENKYKGNRKYFSFGAGFSLNVLKIDAAYMVATAQTSPLDQTLRFTLSFDMDGLKDLLGRR